MPGIERKPARSNKKLLLFLAKIAFTIAMVAYIARLIARQDGFDAVWGRLGELHWGWWAGAIAMQLVAVGFATARFRLMLSGQGIHGGWRFAFGSLMIARFWGAFTPGGFTGFGGWRIYEVSVHTKKVARATATIGVEMLLGKVGFAITVMAASVFGMRFIGADGVLLVNGVFAVVVAGAVLLVSRPEIFRRLAAFLPHGVRTRVQTLVDAICAYKGRGKLLVQAVALSVGVHAFNNMIYVCAARALGVELGVGEVFFASSLQILVTLVPASINGIGLREAAAVALYTSPAVGLPVAVAVLIPVVGIAAEYTVSAAGGLFFLARRSGYDPGLVVDDPDREQAAHAAIEVVDRARWPRPTRGLVIGLGAGLLAGVLVGIGEGAVVVGSAGGHISAGVMTYGAIAYGLLCMLGGAALGLSLAWSGRLMKRAAIPAPLAYARITALIVAFFALALGAFRVRRDVFHEELVWKSPSGLLVLLGCAAAAAVLYLVLAIALRWLLAKQPGRLLLRAWGFPAVAMTLVGLLFVGTLAFGNGAEAAPGRQRARAPERASNVLVVVVDTLRADRLPAYGYDTGSTPHLDAFGEDAVRFDQFFVNSSWTRPSFASILTGRYASSHSVMSKSDQLSNELVTLPEALSAAGYQTAGFVTNYNVAPYYNFQQGFDEYVYLEPEFVLGADDAAAKLLLVQAMRQGIRKLTGVLPGGDYRDAETVNEHLFAWLDRAPSDPWFLFAAYMDPHDPYFVHPYDGTSYGRAGNQNPDPEDAPRMSELYDGEITYWDEHFGRLVEDLKRRGVYDELTIVVTSDHGEELFDHGGFWHGTTLYDEQIRVPLFVKLPGNRRGGTVVRHWAQSIDLMPTILAEMGLAVPAGVQGGSVFDGTDRVYAEESHEGNVLESVRERRGTDEHKLITANPGNPRGLPSVEVFDVVEDAAEQRDLSEDRELTTRLASTLIEAGRQAAVGAVRRQTVELDESSVDRLRNLGYGGE